MSDQGSSPPSAPHEARFAELFEHQHMALLAYAVRRVAAPADAADVVAETFLVAWRRIEEVPAGADARPWLFGVARHVLANVQRSERRRLALADRLRDELELTAPAPETRLSEVERALDRLPDDDQELLRLVAWEQLARDEIAVVLGVSRATVRVRLHRARKRLTEQLERLAADDGQGAQAARAVMGPARPAARGDKTMNGWLVEETR